MSCATDCFVASGFIGGSLYLMLTDKETQEKKNNFKKLMKGKEEEIKKIKKERLMIWIKATIYGLFASITFSKFQSAVFPNDFGVFNHSCVNTLIFFVVQYLAYILHKKSDWIANHIENNEQAKAWIQKFRSMQYRWHFGILLGLIGYFFINKVIFSRIKN